ncbi:hypothetical protein ZIOFF_044157 [Zingiber officinale]|uniref:Uncharacterized protein n=1 Tax=Zingiber officinale TaxID=94328 RepID=A0A8J5FY01_ZINOF|nr:hypothetical protein ZIOFF_044157 [Zingiber officinale]
MNQQEDSVDIHVLPTTMIGYKESTILKAYISSVRRSAAKLLYGGTRIRPSRASTVALFSSRGPSLTNPFVIKLDLIALGVNIIAAHQLHGPVREVYGVPARGRIAGLVRVVHPTWTLAAVRSAMMTTADVTDHLG